MVGAQFIETANIRQRLSAVQKISLIKIKLRLDCKALKV